MILEINGFSGVKHCLLLYKIIFSSKITSSSDFLRIRLRICVVLNVRRILLNNDETKRLELILHRLS